VRGLGNIGVKRSLPFDFFNWITGAFFYLLFVLGGVGYWELRRLWSLLLGVLGGALSSWAETV